MSTTQAPYGVIEAANQETVNQWTIAAIAETCQDRDLSFHPHHMWEGLDCLAVEGTEADIAGLTLDLWRADTEDSLDAHYDLMTSPSLRDGDITVWPELRAAI